MAIYKLEEIAKSVTISKKPDYPQYVLNTSDVFLNKYNPKVVKEKIEKHFQKTVRKNEIIFSKIRPTNGRWALIENNNSWLISTDFIVFKACEKYVLTKYLYILLTKKIINEIGKISENRNSCFPRITFNSISNIKINVPYLKIQKQIIDIIEPIEKLIFNMKKIKVHLWNLIKKIKIKKTKQVNIFSSIKTGNLNVNASLKNGKYPFFTCGKKILKTNSKSFKGRYILLSGNGELYSWWIDGEFNLYQRVYALKEKSNFFTTYYSLIKGIDKLRRRANGAVIKFIKINDIKSVSLYESSHEKILETIFIAINKCEKIENEVNNILDFIVQILIK